MQIVLHLGLIGVKILVQLPAEVTLIQSAVITLVLPHLLPEYLAQYLLMVPVIVTVLEKLIVMPHAQRRLHAWLIQLLLWKVLRNAVHQPLIAAAIPLLVLHLLLRLIARLREEVVVSPAVLEMKNR